MDNNTERKVRVTAELPDPIHRMLLKLCKYYRTNNVSHCLRLVIEDRCKETETEEGGKRLATITGTKGHSDILAGGEE